MQIILQPIANDVAFSNYNKTIIQSTDLATIKPFLSDTELDLLKKQPSGEEFQKETLYYSTEINDLFQVQKLL